VDRRFGSTVRCQIPSQESMIFSSFFIILVRLSCRKTVGGLKWSAERKCELPASSVTNGSDAGCTELSPVVAFQYTRICSLICVSLKAIEQDSFPVQLRHQLIWWTAGLALPSAVTIYITIPPSMKYLHISHTRLHI